ncbi:efflux RND transporter periplasmic adaptor subunit [Olivibacter sp. CPCC 100613]|uniref:efflux RND transporter periplasmic adaptor subunit n=1 Tax=Olivibacter sp. CPCC 100613 TaxID=3079931 RepID=UPI002FFCD92A
MNAHRFVLLTSGLFSIACLLARCTSPIQKAEAENQKTKEESTSLEIFRLTKGQLSSSIKIPGELIAYQQVDLYAKVNSFVKKLNVDVGSVVAAGQILATMEAPELNSQLAGAESRLKSQEAVYLASKATYQRLLETSKTPGTVSQNDLDLALAKQNSDLAQFKAAQAAYREVGDTKNYLEIRAPFSGIITARNVSAGAYVGPSGKGSEWPIFTLQQQDKLRLVVSVPELYSAYLNHQNEVKFSVKSLPNESFSAKVARLAGALDPRLRSQRIEMDVNNNNKRLLPGMITEVEVPLTGSEHTFVVPTEAVLNSTLGTYVIKVEHDSAKWIPINLGRQADGKSEVFGPLDESSQLVRIATEEIRDKEPLNTPLKVVQ